jgi:hypothetical protein
MKGGGKIGETQRWKPGFSPQTARRCLQTAFLQDPETTAASQAAKVPVAQTGQTLVAEMPAPVNRGRQNLTQILWKLSNLKN